MGHYPGISGVYRSPGSRCYAGMVRVIIEDILGCEVRFVCFFCR